MESGGVDGGEPLVKVFISWSKEPSLTLAKILRGWLPSVLNDQVEPWVSSEDIEKGRLSLSEIRTPTP